MTEDLVFYETYGSVGIITLNRPAKLKRSFCAGYDIGSPDLSRDSWQHDALRWHAHLTPQLASEMMPWYMRKPVIASVQGHAVGGGCELTMYCDLTIAAANAMFGEPEVRFSNTGPGIVMPWIIGYKRSRELLYFGDMIDAETALRIGMINQIVTVHQQCEATLKSRNASRWSRRRPSPRPSCPSTAASTPRASATPCRPAWMPWHRFMRRGPRRGRHSRRLPRSAAWSRRPVRGIAGDDDYRDHPREKRRTTFSNSREIGPSKPLRHRLPQKVIEPTENTAPPDGVSKYTISPRDRSSTFSPLMVWIGDSNSSVTVRNDGSGFSDRARITVPSGVPSIGSARSSSKPAAPPPDYP